LRGGDVPSENRAADAGHGAGQDAERGDQKIRLIRRDPPPCPLGGPGTDLQFGVLGWLRKLG